MTARPLRQALIDLGAVASNVATLRSAVGTDHAMAVVKAKGYGHGAVPVARAALDGGADWLGVAEIPEALELRRAGLTAPILTWLHGPEASFAEAIADGVDIGVNSLTELERVVAAASMSSGTPHVQVKVDTGLSRNGVPRDEIHAVLSRTAELERLGRLHVRGMFSHLANASETDDAAQVGAFEDALAIADSVGLRPELRHLASTAGAIRVPRARFDLVRLGIGIYGLSPFDDEGSESLGLRPAMELSAQVVATKRVDAGSGISYGYSYRTPTTSTLALIPLGYADGVPRQASNRGPVLINGQRYWVAGRVAMDQLVVDVGDGDVRPGDRAVLFGDTSTGAPSADEWARAADTINYDIVTRVGGRVELTYTDGRGRDVSGPPTGTDTTTTTTTVTVATPEGMAALGARIARELLAGDVIALDGELGAGKTTFTRGLGAALGVRGAVTSPTFVLARTHQRVHGGPPLVHVDAYRLGGAAEFDDLDIDLARSITVVEWAGDLLEQLTDSVLSIRIVRPTGAGASAGSELDADADADADADDDDDLVEPRTVTITALGPRWAGTGVAWAGDVGDAP